MLKVQPLIQKLNWLSWGLDLDFKWQVDDNDILLYFENVIPE